MRNLKSRGVEFEVVTNGVFVGHNVLTTMRQERWEKGNLEISRNINSLGVALLSSDIWYYQYVTCPIQPHICLLFPVHTCQRLWAVLYVRSESRICTKRLGQVTCPGRTWFFMPGTHHVTCRRDFGWVLFIWHLHPSGRCLTCKHGVPKRPERLHERAWLHAWGLRESVNMQPYCPWTVLTRRQSRGCEK